MAAGLGFKTFTTGEVLTAADVNGYLMQGVLVFASEAARDAAITSPQEGQFAFTKDNNSLWYYSGSAWVASGATGDIEGVTAGTGISGGGTSGTVTITNSMATEITAKGDLIVGTGNAAFDNLPAGTNGYILTADSTISPTGLKWAAPAGGGKVLQVVYAETSTFTNSSSSTFADTALTATITPASASNTILVIVTQNGSGKDAVNAGTGLNLRLMRGATAIQTFGGAVGYTGQAMANYIGSVATTFKDSPNTTSATTYKTQIASGTAQATVFVNVGGEKSSMTLIEIGA